MRGWIGVHFRAALPGWKRGRPERRARHSLPRSPENLPDRVAGGSFIFWPLRFCFHTLLCLKQFPVPNTVCVVSDFIQLCLFALCQIYSAFPVYVVSDLFSFSRLRRVRVYQTISVCVSPKLSNYSRLRRIRFYSTFSCLRRARYYSTSSLLCHARYYSTFPDCAHPVSAIVQVYARTVQAVLLLLNLLYATFFLLSIIAALSVSVFRWRPCRGTAVVSGGRRGRGDAGTQGRWARRDMRKHRNAAQAVGRKRWDRKPCHVLLLSVNSVPAGAGGAGGRGPRFGA